MGADRAIEMPRWLRDAGAWLSSIPHAGLVMNQAGKPLLVWWPAYWAATKVLVLPAVFPALGLASLGSAAVLGWVWAARGSGMKPADGMAVSLTLFTGPLLTATAVYMLAPGAMALSADR